ncbi:hypothetical protein, partial [Streptomyces sp. NPDC048057]|uniref:hypothetical protein n=1 Tax=Streptomyces sp. NPDC048057 TaxID=3155628 RepID=UPI0033E0246F
SAGSARCAAPIQPRARAGRSWVQRPQGQRVLVDRRPPSDHEVHSTAEFDHSHRGPQTPRTEENHP